VPGLTIHLVRHADHALVGRELVGRSPGISLSEAGRVQARVLAERLARESVERVETGPLERARETAAAIAGRAGVPLHVDEDLDEVDFGGWTGAAFDDLAGDEEWRRWNMARSVARAPQGETIAAVVARMTRKLERLQVRHGAGSVVLVSHCEPIRATLLQVLGLPPEAWRRLEIATASISTLVFDDAGARIAKVNETVAP
jgi:probable phosphoglycerate mutase